MSGAHRRIMSRKFRGDRERLLNHYRSHGCNPNVMRETEIVYMSYTDAAKMWTEKMVRDGKIAREDADTFWNENTRDIEATKIVISVTSAVIEGLRTPLKLLKELKKSFLGVRISVLKGKTYIIFKGNPALRGLITGTRYSINHPKMVNLGFGKKGIKAGARGGFIVGFLIIAAFNITDLVLKDDYNWKHFVSAMSVDVGILVVSTAAGVAAGIIVAGLAGVAAFTVGPIIVAVAVSILVGLALGGAADRLKLKEKIVIALDTLGDSMSSNNWDGSPIVLEGDSRGEAFIERILQAFGISTPKIRGYNGRR